MSFSTDMDADLLPIADASLKAAIKTAFTDFETAIKAQVVTAAGFTAAAAPYVDMQDQMRDLAQYIAAEMKDQSD